jgi:hypothetical protein
MDRRQQTGNAEMHLRNLRNSRHLAPNLIAMPLALVLCFTYDCQGAIGVDFFAPGTYGGRIQKAPDEIRSLRSTPVC